MSVCLFISTKLAHLLHSTDSIRLFFTDFVCFDLDSERQAGPQKLVHFFVEFKGWFFLGEGGFEDLMECYASLKIFNGNLMSININLRVLMEIYKIL